MSRAPLSNTLLESGSAIRDLQGSKLSTAKSPPSENPGETKVLTEFERDIALLLRAENRDPFRLLGPHIAEEADEKRLVVRGFFPRASEVFVLMKGHPDPMPAGRISSEGLFEAILPLFPALPISPVTSLWPVKEPGQPEREFCPAYACPPLSADFDLYLMGEGTHYLKYEKMGAHPTVVE